MDVRIGVIQVARELVVEVGDDVDRDALLSQVSSQLSGGDGVLTVTDRKGKVVVVPAAKVAYVEVGSASDDRRIGFGS